jgi:hypothetical protein
MNELLLPFAVALGIGLLIGAERERRKGSGPARSPAGIRTFTVVSLAGAAAFSVGGALLLAVLAAGIAALLAVAYWRSTDEDPGLTTEVALLVTLFLGALAIREPVVASALAVCVAILLAARSPLHRFTRRLLTAAEMTDALILCASALVVLPLLPDRDLGPFDALNPRSLWMVVVLVMAIGAAGHIATRALGARHGLPLTGLMSGFVSSTATIGAMGSTREVRSGDVASGRRGGGAVDGRDDPADDGGARRGEPGDAVRDVVRVARRGRRGGGLRRRVHAARFG